MKKKGSVTVYLSIILVGVILVVSVVAESARISMVQSQSKAFTYMAADSLFAQYGRQIYEDYGILLVWEKESVEEQMKKYIQANINMADLNVEGTNLMGTNLVGIDIEEIEYATENGGEKLIEQIGSYMKYSGLLEATELLLEDFEVYEKNSEAQISKNKDVTDIVEKTSEELQQYVKEINNIVKEIKDVENIKKKLSVVSQKMEKIKDTIASGKEVKKVSGFLKEYRELITEFDKKADNVDSAIERIEKYEEKKELFLKENGYTSDAGDYIDENLNILKNIRSKINEVKGLNVSEFSNIDSKNILTVENAVKKAQTVKNELKSLRVNEVTKEDEKNQSIFESAKKLLEEGFLSMVVEDVSDISSASISDSNLPTKLNNKQRGKNILQDKKDKAILALYSENKFGNFVKPKEDTALKYEMEYIICGEYNDRENLLEVVKKLVATRNVINAAYLITDSGKMSEISSVALSAATALGLPFMEPIIKVVLMEAWSLAEAVNDVKILLGGNKVKLVKNKQNWKTSLSNLSVNTKAEKESTKGLDYKQYCELLIILQSGNQFVYRIMDLMQVNIQKKYNKDFLISQCFQEIKVTANFETKQLFTAIPFSIKMLSNTGEAYKYKINCSYGY